MKVIIFGATGGTGTEVLKQAIDQGHQVTAFVRDPSKLVHQNENLSANDHLDIVSGDVLDLNAVEKAMQGQDAVICSLGSNSLAKTTVRSKGTANIIKAMEEEHVGRLVVVSAMGTGDSWSALSFVNKLFYATLLRSSRQDHEAQETLVKSSDLNWTILRPSGLTDGPLTRNYAIGEKVQAKSSQISRADVAHAIIQELEKNVYPRRAVTITQEKV